MVKWGVKSVVCAAWMRSQCAAGMRRGETKPWRCRACGPRLTWWAHPLEPCPVRGVPCVGGFPVYRAPVWWAPVLSKPWELGGDVIPLLSSRHRCIHPPRVVHAKVLQSRPTDGVAAGSATLWNANGTGPLSRIKRDISPSHIKRSTQSHTHAHTHTQSHARTHTHTTTHKQTKAWSRIWASIQTKLTHTWTPWSHASSHTARCCCHCNPGRFFYRLQGLSEKVPQQVGSGSTGPGEPAAPSLAAVSQQYVLLP